MFSQGFPQDRKVTYAAMLWLLAAQLVVMAPLAFYLPVWILPVLLFSAAWRIRVMKGHMEQPGIIIKLLVAILGIAALSISGLKLVSLDMMASLLMLGFAYKTLEVIQRRDAMVVLLTGFLLIGVSFLYSQSILSAFYGVFALTVLAGAMIAIQQSKSHSIFSTLRSASLMVIMCLPLMLVFFVFTPRFDPLWTIPMEADQGKTGISDSMTPGDIAQLSKSDELAFTATFQGEAPKQSNLYWRGLVLEYFDGRTWTPAPKKLDFNEIKNRLRVSRTELRERLVKKGYGKKYDVIYEKTGQHWLFTLSPVVDLRGDAFYTTDFRIIAERKLLEPTMLTVVSYPEALRDTNLPEAVRQSALQLPKKGNPKSWRLAKKLMRQSKSKQEYIDTVLNRYTQQDYYYTLRPPVLGEQDTIDRFLFESKRGFCAHYAGSFVFMMRAAGIPARIITGYQGGTLNKKGNFYSIRQFDAHAWTEVWLENQGWVRFDPTAKIAPERIEENLEAAVKKEGSFLEGQYFSMSRYKWLSGLKNKLDETQYAWRRFVLGYDTEAQKGLLTRLFGEITIYKIAALVGGFFLAIILFWAVLLGLGRKASKEKQEHQIYRRFCDLLAKYGVKRELSQTPLAFSQYAVEHMPALATDIKDFTKLYSELCYNPDRQQNPQESIKTLKSILKNIRKNAKKGGDG